MELEETLSNSFDPWKKRSAPLQWSRWALTPGPGWRGFEGVPIKVKMEEPWKPGLLQYEKDLIWMIYKTHTYMRTVPYRTVPYVHIYIYIHTHIGYISIFKKQRNTSLEKKTGDSRVASENRHFILGFNWVQRSLTMLPNISTGLSLSMGSGKKSILCAMEKNDKNCCFGGIPYFQTTIFSKMTESQVPFFSLCGRAWGRSEPPQSPGKEEHHWVFKLPWQILDVVKKRLKGIMF